MTLRLFANGVQVASKAQTGTLATSANPLQIGGDAIYGQYFAGRIDEVRVYSTALSQLDIQSDMANPVTPNPNAPKLVITAPAEGSTVAGGTVNIGYTTTGDLTGVDHVHFQVDTDVVKMDLTLDGTYAYPGVRVGSHTLNGWLVRADHTKIAGTDATPVHFSNVVDPADPTAPTVGLTAPTNGASVFGVVTVSANAADNVGIYGVQFKRDGVALGVEDLTAPYSVNWDTSTAGNGSHVLTATARDAAGNETTATPVTVTVANSGTDPAQVGQWSTPTTLPIVPIHTSMLPNGKLLIFDSSTDSGTNPRVWDPVTNSFTQVPYNNTANLFCAGHTPLPDGRILVAGGHIDAYVGLRNATIFDPATNTWSDVQPMANARWYPTLTKLPDGRMLAVSGSSDCPDCATPGAIHNGIVPAPEIFDPATNTWSTVTGANLRLPLYPNMYVLPDGRIFAATTAEEAIASRVLDLNARTWSVVDSAVREGGSSVMYLPGKILKTGKAWNPDYPVAAATNEAWVIDMNQTGPTWRQVSSMAFPRTQHQLTVLPDGTVLATGGSRNSDVNDQANAVLAAELWDPTTETWRTLSSGVVPRLYHSSATLLPDGRVEIGGGGHPPGFGIAEYRSEIFSPPYLFKGARPTITSAPTQANYGQSFFVATPDGSTITKIALIPAAQPDARVQFELRLRPADLLADHGWPDGHGACEREHRTSRHVHALCSQHERCAVRCLVGENLGTQWLEHRGAARRSPRRCQDARPVLVAGCRRPGLTASGVCVDLRLTEAGRHFWRERISQLVREARGLHAERKSDSSEKAAWQGAAVRGRRPRPTPITAEPRRPDSLGEKWAAVSSPGSSASPDCVRDLPASGGRDQDVGSPRRPAGRRIGEREGVRLGRVAPVRLGVVPNQVVHPGLLGGWGCQKPSVPEDRVDQSAIRKGRQPKEKVCRRERRRRTSTAPGTTGRSSS